MSFVRSVRRKTSALGGRPRLVGRAALPVGSAGGGGFLVQGVFPPLHGHGGSLLAPLGLLVIVAFSGALGGKLLGIIVPRSRRALRTRLSERRHLLAAANTEVRSRALMSELCPHGWRAQITLFGPADELPPDAPDGESASVALDWAELDHDGSRAVVMRRVWARTIAEALEAMVADRRTDETLEQIERGAVADGTIWLDL